MSATHTESVASSALRRTLVWLAGGTLGLTALAATRAGARFMTPPLITQPPAPAVVSAADAPAINLARYVPPVRAYLMRDAQGYYAVAATCTHLGCLVELGGDGLHCPCHGGTYDRNGNVITGPATRALPHFAVTWGENGDLVIDPNQPVDAVQRLSG